MNFLFVLFLQFSEHNEGFHFIFIYFSFTFIFVYFSLHIRAQILLWTGKTTEKKNHKEICYFVITNRLIFFEATKKNPQKMRLLGEI